MPIPLEDNFCDIIAKAMRGLALTDAQVAAAANVTPAAVHDLRTGSWDEATARAIAPGLQLRPDALADSGNVAWNPAPIALAGLAQINTPFQDMTVNAYLVWDPESRIAAAFDTGVDVSEQLATIARAGLRLEAIYLTHTHGDHVYELDRFREKTGAPAFVGDREPFEGAEIFPAGREFALSALKIETRLTWGHSKGGISYVITGLAHPLAIVGDALFAGSMGGGAVSYDAAMETNHAELFSLPDDTIVCPGHGPLTTIGEEKAHNPFYRL